MKHRYIIPYALFSFVFSAYRTVAQTALPSARLLVGSWSQYEQMVQAHIHSYHIVVHSVGRDIMISTSLGQPRAMPECTKEGTVAIPNYRIKNTCKSQDGNFTAEIAWTPAGFDMITSDGHHATCLHHNPTEAIADYRRTFDNGDNSPSTLEDVFKSPNLNRELYAAQMPLYSYYLAHSSKLQVVGTDIIGGRTCYHVHFSDTSLSEDPVPQDLWFAPLQNYFFPVRLITTTPDDQVEVNYPTWQPFGGVLLPTQIERIYLLPKVLSNGSTGFAPNTGTHQVYTLQINDVNHNFPEAIFHVSCSQYAKAINSKPASNAIKATYLLFILIVLFILFASVLLRKRLPHKNV